MASGRQKRRGSLKTANACIFCGLSSGGISKQHLIPAWMQKVVPLDPNQRNHISATHMTRHSAVAPPQRRYSVTQRNGAPQSRRLRKVCVSCNTGWMSQLETLVKPFLAPMLIGDPRNLTANQQQALAAWAEQVVMVNEFAELNQVVSSQADRKHLMDRMTAGANSRVWIGRFADSNRHGWVGHEVLHVPGRSRLIVPVQANARADVIVVGVVFLFVSAAVDAINVHPGFSTRPDLGIGLKQIWPVQRELVKWPSGPVSITERTAEQLRLTWPPSL